MTDIKNILATPLNLPRTMPDSWEAFWRIWQRDAVPFVRTRPDTAGNRNPTPPWKGFIWEFEPEHVYSPQTMWNVTTRNYSHVFPEWRKQLQEIFPFRIHRLIFQNSFATITPHRDGTPITDYLNYPCAVRIMILDTNTVPTFYYQLNDVLTDRIYQQFPKDVNTWVYHNTEILHGSDYHGHFKILAQVVFDQVIEHRWFELLQNSRDAWPHLCYLR